ncbi:mannitol dehydrogenase family protein [Nakamurella sp.]|uniref:mannitol dehydrogenase family protein n=1 Tax=Nakamurella sp. TaxID=1869182 RepID=UPI003B3BAD09
MPSLSADALAALDPRVAVPAYDRADVTVGIVHIGVGAFHRAHQAVYVDDVLAAGDRAWGICGVGVLPQDSGIRDALAAQDGLYTLLTVDGAGATAARVVGSHVAHLHAPDDPQAVIDRMADPATRIVTLTITEGGYGIDDATGQFEPSDPLTLADLAGQTPPRSGFGLIVAALAARRAAGTAPFTVLSCDNIQHNGAVTRAALTGFARAGDPELADWIGAQVAFPNSMVDRITPVTTDAVRAAVTGYGVTDAAPVRSEAFRQWVIEDRFSAGRPALEQVGVQIVPDVPPYEKMKLRLLNASHQVMSYLGALAGFSYVHEFCRDPEFAEFLLGYLHAEAIPTLDPVPGIDLTAYCRSLIERFGSEAILDTLARQTVDASVRIPTFVLPVLRDRLAAGGDIRRATLAVAAWSRYLEGATDAGAPLEISPDRRRAGLQAAVEAERRTPGAFLDPPVVFGELAGDARFRAAFVAARAELAERGARAAAVALG